MLRERRLSGGAVDRRHIPSSDELTHAPGLSLSPVSQRQCRDSLSESQGPFSTVTLQAARMLLAGLAGRGVGSGVPGWTVPPHRAADKLSCWKVDPLFSIVITCSLCLHRD